MGRPRIKYETGQQIGNCTYIQEIPVKAGTDRRALFQCSCGIVFTGIIRNIKTRQTRSCGCKRNEEYRRRHKPVEELRRSHKYASKYWSMINRCYSPNNKDYKNYGGRGITVCDEWRKDFWSYIEHISSLPNYGEEGRSIDRIKNDGNYEPGNLRWATAKQQNNNKRVNQKRR